MYQTFLYIHSYLRWAVLILGILAIVKYFIGWNSKKPFSASDKKIATFFVASLDTQLIIGLILYFFLSPITKAAMSNMGTAMKDTVLRFWAVEHITMMIIAVVVAHVGSVVSRKAPNDALKYKRGFIYFLIAFIIIIISIPWPFRDQVGRAFFPGM